MNEHEDVRINTEVCDQIQSLAISAAPESTGVTTFVQEACTAVSAVDPSFSKTMYKLQNTLQDVREYFSRPVCIQAAGVPSGRGSYWNNNNTFSYYLSRWDNGIARLEGAYGIRAKIVMTLQVSATPFHSGLICLSGQYGIDTSLTGVYDRSKDPCTVTNLPHVVLDVSNDTSVQLHMPFLFPTEYCTVRGIANEVKYVNFSLNNMTLIPTIAGMGQPTYQIFIHLEDIELFGATPQATTAVTLTAGRKLSPVTEEFENDAFPFSSALHNVGKAVSFIAKGVPSLSSIGGPVSWALGKAAGVVRYFGYGKPAVVDPVMRVFRQDNVGEFNTDVATGTMVLAATAANTTSINTFVGASDVDEMSLSYVTSRWSQICLFDYSTSVAAGTLIYATPINMLAFWFRYPGSLPAANIIVPRLSTATTNAVQPSHLMFAASSFKQWRGGIKFRFTFAKTKMHAGRVMVTFNPDSVTTVDTNVMTSATIVNLPNYGVNGPDPFGYSAIFDLKDGNVFEFKVPYVAATPYSNLSAYVGGLAMYVVNPLIASSVVSSSISVVVQVAGDSDFELANPAGVMFPVHNSGTIRLNAGRVLSEAPEALNQLTMGEAITSVKQLISIPTVLKTNTSAPISQIIPPWYYQQTPSVVVPASGLPGYDSAGYGGNWASCYGFLKGGTDVHIYTVDATTLISVVQMPGAGGYLPNTTTPDNRNFGNLPTLITGRSSLHVRLPGFFPTSRVFSWIANVLTATGTNFPNNPFTLSTKVTPYIGIQAIYAATLEPAGTNTAYFNLNASDDAQLGHYIGPPPIFLPAASGAGAYVPQAGIQPVFA